jgi:hypothetical protein
MKELALSFMRSSVITNELGGAAGALTALLRSKDLFEELCTVPGRPQ